MFTTNDVLALMSNDPTPIERELKKSLRYGRLISAEVHLAALKLLPAMGEVKEFLKWQGGSATGGSRYGTWDFKNLEYRENGGHLLAKPTVKRFKSLDEMVERWIEDILNIGTGRLGFYQ